MSRQKAPQSKVDKALSKLSEEDLKEWSNLVRFNSNYPELRSWLASRGHQVSNENLSNWWITNRPRGEEVITINALAERYEGIEVGAIAQWTISMCIAMILKLEKQIELEDIREADKLTNFVNLIRELHTAINNYQKLQRSSDKKTWINAGAYEVATKLKIMFKDSPMAEGLEIAIEGILIEINE